MVSRTFHVILWISSLTILSGCALLEPPDEDSLYQQKGPALQVYRASYDEVWRAIQKVMVKFPIIVNNIDQGVLETEPIKIDTVWTRPQLSSAKKRIGKYTLHINAVKGRARGQDATRVIVLKKVIVDRDFFSDERQLPSDGYEEDMILYRIQREVVIERSLKRAFERGNEEFETIPESEFDDLQ